MPAPAVIPALIAYVKVVAVKTLVVGTRSRDAFVELSAVAMCASVCLVAAECCWDFSRVPNRPGREPCGDSGATRSVLQGHGVWEHWCKSRCFVAPSA